MGSKIRTDFLAGSPSYTTGAARLLDWAGQFDAYNGSPNGREADAKALAADWNMVGEDLANAMAEFETSASV